ncbi:MAG: DeoR/GlpR family transcriptional regulator [Rhodospirillales bacterium]|jgi:DeoR family glycerol-3-phosphate regulon repressor|nr:DeoR/GlpR family transcriptional regulator [Rhodospirillales bacterium]
MPKPTPRQNEIVELVQRHGYVSVETLAQRFGVTPQTVRRDINLLSDMALVQRHHGGAGVLSSVENVAYSTRQVLCQEEKRRIARLLVSHIPDHASLFINIGTTTEEVAKALLGHKGLRIITNNLNVATILCSNPDFEVVVAGGTVRSRDRGIIGEATIDLITQFKVDFGIIGISGIDSEGILLDFDYREVRVAKAIVENSRRVYLATDHTKFGRNAMVRMGNIEQITALFTDQTPPAPIRKLLADHGVALFVADPPPSQI